MAPELSVVVATYNRPDGVVELLRDLDGQDGFAPGAFEVIVIDDGSRVPVRPLVEALGVRYPLRFVEQTNAGQAVARHRGLTMAEGDVVVIVDDDMRLPADFLSAHRAAHRAGAEVVQGAIAPPEHALPIFERWHARELVRLGDSIREGRWKFRGAQLATGNVSLRRRLYFGIGGFDPELQRSEDRDLGIRLERAGARLEYSHDAVCVHNSDHASLKVWLRRSFNYGVYDSRIADKHDDIEYVDPWRFLFEVSWLSRPALLLAVAAPPVGKALSHAAMGAALVAERLRMERVALAGTTFAYGVEYFRGVRSAAGSFGRSLRALGRYLVKRSAEKRRAGRAAPLVAWRDFRRAVHTDWSVMAAGRAKYLGEGASRRWIVDIVTKIGLQMTYATRVMRLLRDSGLRTSARFASRMIRHVYAAEIHWDAEIAPGTSVIHGNGLVVSHAARVAEGCVLCHNVTLGMGIDPATGRLGAPTLERNVHVGPGATLIGPIVVGEGTKIMAGSVLNCSVPPYSLVRPAPVQVVPREPGKRGGGGVSAADFDEQG